MSRITINSNISALGAQRNLGQTTAGLRKTFERLSSGLRINRAADDAAGLAIASALRADTRILTQGIRNLNDGLSLLAIADSALAELTNITIRISELAEQSANGVYSATHRQMLDAEAQTLSEEYTRIVESAEFNSIKLLDGSTTQIDLQAGLSSAPQDRITIPDISEGALRTVGTGTFEAGVMLGFPGGGTDGGAFGDVNGDGVLDMVYTGGGIIVHRGNGDGTFNAPEQQSNLPNIYIAHLVDFDGDGALDISGTDRPTESEHWILYGNGDGSFEAPVSIGPAYELFGNVADINNDGRLDIVTGDHPNDVVHVYRNDGNRNFTQLADVSAVNAARGTELADFNGDGILDLVSSTNSLDTMLHLGDGAGGFNTVQTLSSTGGHRAVGDFNNDGFQDVVSAPSGGPILRVMLGNGNGSLRAPMVVPYDASAGAVNDCTAVADLNNDDNPDLLLRADDVLYVLLGKGDGTFDTAVSYPEVASPTRINAADLNGDGALDLGITTISGADATILIAETRSIPGMPSFDLLTADSARDALGQMESVRSALTHSRAKIGASQSRIQTAIQASQVGVENFAAAESRIMDADIAVQSAKLVRLQILQQAGAAVLAQANASPELALQLLS